MLRNLFNKPMRRKLLARDYFDSYKQFATFPSLRSHACNAPPMGRDSSESPHTSEGSTWEQKVTVLFLLTFVSEAGLWAHRGCKANRKHPLQVVSGYNAYLGDHSRKIIQNEEAKDDEDRAPAGAKGSKKLGLDTGSKGGRPGGRYADKQPYLSMDQVAKHNLSNDAWVVIDGNVWE